MTPGLQERLRRAEDDPRDGLRRLLPDRLGLHPLRQDERDWGRAWTRFGGGLDRRLRALEIADIDPIKYDLLFERFLNPGRKTMPDIDIDFSVYGRDQVINYVADKYGRDQVAQIITFGTMMARAAVRDAGRVLDIPYGTVDKVAKLIPEGPKYLDDCLKPGAELKQAYDADEIVRQIVDLAKPLEGLVRQDSIHAAGVVIGDRPLTEYLRCSRRAPTRKP